LEGPGASQPQHLEKIFISRIRYDTIQERELAIKDAFQGTFRWIFDDENTTGFKNWLSSDGKLYWITGKPGSGKSTLMRYLMQPTGLSSRQSRCEEHLRQWVESRENLTIISFHFWAIGSPMQRTKEGLFRTLLIQLFQDHPEVIPTVAPSRWESLSLFNEDPQHLTETELGDMFRQAITHISTRAKLALFIDGLDEFDGDCNALVSLIGECISWPIKICVSSRPWTEFENAFGEYPQLKMEDLTYNDMTRYIMAKFGANSRFRTFQERQPEVAIAISRSVTKKANGVFLWVNIVVSSLLAGIVSGDRIEDLESRLDLLPPEIQDLYEKIIESIDPIYREHAAQLFKLKSTCTDTPSLQLLWYADEVKFLERAIDEVSGTVTVKEMEGRLEDMRLRLVSRCKGLLEVHKHASPKPCRSSHKISPDEVAAYTGGTVTYLHRTFSDFLDRHEVQEKLDGFIVKTYDPNLRISAAYVALAKLWLRSMAMDRNGDYLFQIYAAQSLWHAADAKESSTSETVQLLNHLRAKCAKSCKFSYKLFGHRYVDQMTDHCHPNPNQGFICLATVLGVGQYIKARTNEPGLMTTAQETNQGSLSRISRRIKSHSNAITTFLLPLVYLPGHNNQSVIRALLEEGAKPNETVRMYNSQDDTAWEKLLANAILLSERSLDDNEQDNLTQCVRLMIDGGAKISIGTAERAMKISRQYKKPEYMLWVPSVVAVDLFPDVNVRFRSRRDMGSEGICELLMGMRRDPGAKFDLKSCHYMMLKAKKGQSAS
jgi:energy-coupling factor transporter ATP-binding protein EcfA2